MTLVEYLSSCGIGPKGCRVRELAAGRWVAWLGARGLAAAEVGYADVMAYVGELRGSGRSRGHINRALGAIRYHSAWLGLPDASHGVRLRGVQHAADPQLLTGADLAAVYEAFVGRGGARRSGGGSGAYALTDELVVGLVVFQGLEQAELGRLEVRDVDVQRGRIEVPAGRVRLARRVGLEAHQVAAWARYLEGGRAEVTRAIERRRGGPLDVGLADALLPTAGGVRPGRLHGQLLGLSAAVRAAGAEVGEARGEPVDPPVTGLRQLRQSRIGVWIEREGLRRAQYLSGLRTVEQVERYRRSRFEDLREAVGVYHPLQ